MFLSFHFEFGARHCGLRAMVVMMNVTAIFSYHFLCLKKAQLNLKLLWSRFTDMLVLHPAHHWAYCQATVGQGKDFPLPQVRQEQNTCVYLVLYRLWRKRRIK